MLKILLNSLGSGKTLILSLLITTPSFEAIAVSAIPQNNPPSVMSCIDVIVKLLLDTTASLNMLIPGS